LSCFLIHVEKIHWCIRFGQTPFFVHMFWVKWLFSLEEIFKYMTEFMTGILVIKDKND
jgi:hypothetical protein